MRIGILVAREAVSLAGIFTIHADYYTLIDKLLIPPARFALWWGRLWTFVDQKRWKQR